MGLSGGGDCIYSNFVTIYAKLVDRCIVLKQNKSGLKRIFKISSIQSISMEVFTKSKKNGRLSINFTSYQ